MDNQQLSYVGPLAPIVGAIVGGIITLAITYFFVIKRKALGFWVAPSEDLTRSLQRHHQQILFSVGGQPFLNLNRATVLVRNTGNVSLENFNFDIEIPGQHDHYLADLIVDNAELRGAVSITTDQPPATHNPTFHVAVSSFLNPKESLRVALFFDGDDDDCELRCRIADVKAKVKSGQPLTWRELWQNTENVNLMFGILTLGSLLAGAWSLALSKLFPLMSSWLGFGGK